VLSGLFLRWGWPALVGEILCGIVLGPTILGRLLPGVHAALFPPDVVQHSMLETISWFGVLFLLLVTGFEIKLSSVWKQGRSSMIIGTVGVFVPIILGCLIFFWFPATTWGASANRLIFTLFLSTAAAISAIPVIAKILHDLEILKSDLGLTTLSAFVVNDILGWLIFTMVLGLAATTATSDVVHPLRTFFEITLFGAVCLTVGSRGVGRLSRWIKQTPLPQTGAVLTLITCLGLLCGIITQWIGIHAILGFFLAGIMAGNTGEISAQTRDIISQIVHAIFVPIFFVSIGIRIDFIQNFNIVIVLIFSFVAVFGKYIGAWLGGILSRMPREDAVSIGIAHIPGGAMEIIIGILAYEMQLISEQVFVAIIFAAVVSSVAVGPFLAWSIKRRKWLDVGDFLLPGAVDTSLSGMTRWEIISELSDQISTQLKTIDSDRIRSAVFEREKAMGTSLEKGVAVPHARLEGIRQPVIAFGRTKLGVDWDSRDGMMTRFVFLVLTPICDEGVQVQILASIARLMMQQNTAVKLMSENDPSKLAAFIARGLKVKRK